MCTTEHEYNTLMQNSCYEFTLRAIIGASCLFLGAFKLVQGRCHAPELWYYIKTLNAFVFSAFGATFIMFQYPITLVICQTQLVMLLTYPLVPLTEAKDFTWTRYIIKATVSIVWLCLTITGLALIVFGTILDQENYDPLSISLRFSNMAKEALLDFECIGSRVWMASMLMLYPNILLICKILTN